MGKKSKEFKANPFDYMGGGRIRELGDRYGVDHKDYNINMGRTSDGGREYKGDRDDYDEAVRKAAMSDYDTRRTMEAQAMAGNKKANKFAKKGFKNIGKVYEGNELMRKLHKKEGNGGSFSSASDFAGLTHASVKADRDAQTAAYDEKYATKNDLNKVKAKSVDEQVEEAQYEPSEKVKQAKERVAGYKDNVSTYGDNDDQRENAAAGYAKYKLNLSTMK